MSDPAEFRLCVKSRRIGISWAMAAECVLESGKSAEAGGQNCYYVCQTESDAQEFMDACTMWARQFNLAAEATGETLIDPENGAAYQVAQLKFASGFKILALSGHPRRLHGKTGMAILDEAALSVDPEGFIEAAGAFLTWGRGRVAIISTESGGTESAFHRWRDEVEAGRRPWSLHVIDIDDAIADGLHERIALVNDWPYDPKKTREDNAAEWRANLKAKNIDHWEAQFLCNPAGAGDVFFDRAAVDAAMEQRPVLRFQPPSTKSEEPFSTWKPARRKAYAREWIDTNLTPLLEKLDKTRPHSMGADFGHTGDITSISPIVTLYTRAKSVPFMVEMRNTPYDVQFQIFCALIDGLPRRGRMAIDAGGIGRQIGEQLWQKYGDVVVRMQVADGKARDPDKRPPAHLYYSEMFPPVKAGFGSAELTIPRDDYVMDDLMGIRNKGGRPTVPAKRTKDRQGQRHYDSAVSLGLAVWASGPDSMQSFAPLTPSGVRGDEAERERRRAKRTGRKVRSKLKGRWTGF